MFYNRPLLVAAFPIRAPAAPDRSASRSSPVFYSSDHRMPNRSYVGPGAIVTGAELRRAREAGLRRNTARNEALQLEHRRIVSIFKNFDVNSDGVLSADEFRHALRRINPELNDAQVREFTRRVDANGDGQIAWDEFSSRLAASSAESVQTPHFLKAQRWQDSGDIVAHTDAGLLTDPGEGARTTTTMNALFSPPSREHIEPAGTHSTNYMDRSRAPLLFEEYESFGIGKRRGRGVAEFQSHGLRFDERGFVTGTQHRPAPSWSPRAEARRPHVHAQRSSVRECLQPDVFRPNTAQPRLRAPEPNEPSERVLHMRQVRARAASLVEHGHHQH